MKIVLSPKGTVEKQGDLVAISRLLGVLEQYFEKYKEESGLSPGIVLELWIDYLASMVSNALAANLGTVKEKTSFSLPFESDFDKRLQAEVEKEE